MATTKKRPEFFSSDEGVIIFNILKTMVSDKAYNTKSSYSANSILYPDNLIPFVDKHMHYLRDHPAVDSQHYISNLRLITKLK